MKQFITSDLHFDHRRIIEYCPLSRGHLSSVDEMNEELIQKYNSKVTEEDHTYILGDIGFGKPERTMEFLKRLNGTKTIILGNHDRKLQSSSIFNEPIQRRLAGIVEVDNYKTINQTVGGAKYGVVLFHFRIAAWDGMHHGSIHLFGHAHGSTPDQPGRCMDIGVDTNDLYPYELNQVVLSLSKKPMNYDGHHGGTKP